MIPNIEEYGLMNALPKRKIYINARFLTQPITGVQRYSHELVRTLDELIDRNAEEVAPYRFELLAPRGNHLYKLPLKHIPLRRLGFSSGHFWEQLLLPFYIKGGLLFCPGNSAPALTLLSKTPTVVTVHDLSYRYFPSAYSFAFKQIYKILMPIIIRRAKAIITVSQSEKKSILTHYPFASDKIYAIQNGGLPGRFLASMRYIPPVRTATDVPVLLYVGSLSRRKNLHGVLQAVQLLNQKMPVSLVVAGASGKTFRQIKYPVPQELMNKVLFKGQIKDTGELIRLYQKATCLVFPSFYEASPLPPIEAMACGCPVIASAIPSLQERCGDAALFCDPHDTVDIAKKIRQFLQDQILQKELSQRGLEQARKFTWENCALKTLEVLGKHF